MVNFKLSSNGPSRLVLLLVLTLRPLGVSLDLAARHPWEAIGKYFDEVSVANRYGGIVHLAETQKRGNQTRALIRATEHFPVSCISGDMILNEEEEEVLQ